MGVSSHVAIRGGGRTLQEMDNGGNEKRDKDKLEFSDNYLSSSPVQRLAWADHGMVTS